MIFKNLCYKKSMDKIKKIRDFGKRLAMLRKEQGLTQQQLADKIDVTRRVIAYYEVESDNPPGNIIILLSKALNISTDELLGFTPAATSGKPSLKLTRRMKKIENLPPSQQKVLLKTIDTFLKGAQA